MEQNKVKRAQFQSRSETRSLWRESAWLADSGSFSPPEAAAAGTWSGSVPVGKLILEQGSCRGALGASKAQQEGEPQGLLI